MRKLLALLILLWVAVPAAHAQPSAQPILCDRVGIGQSLAAGTTQVIAGVSGQIISVCGFMLDLNANGTLQLVFGTGASCTSSTPLTALITVLTNDHIVNHPPYAFASGKPGESLCAIVTGTGSVLNTDIYYIQRP